MEPNPGATEEAASGVLVVFTSGARVERGPRLEWIRIAGIAVAISINGFAALYASLPPSERGLSFARPEPVHGLRHALVVERVETMVIDPPEEHALPVLEQAVSRQAPRQSLPVQRSALPVSQAEPSPEPAPRFRFGVGQLQSQAAPVSAPPHDPKAAAAIFYRRPAITYEPTRFNDAWQPVSLAERARQSTFSYARLCSLNDEMRQNRGCSRDERNAAAAAQRGVRVDTAMRPDAAVD